MGRIFQGSRGQPGEIQGAARGSAKH